MATGEYAAAWELEVWKQAQEAKWTASMRARESERMEALEGEWRRREAQRETEHRRASSDAAALEKRLSASLASVEERERRLVAEGLGTFVALPGAELRGIEAYAEAYREHAAPAARL